MMHSRLGSAVSLPETEDESSDNRPQSGMVVLWFALSLTVLLGCCGFAVDIGRWYFEAQHLQKAADAAALAGVISLPADTATAKSVAQTVSTQNGYANNPVLNVSVQPCPGPGASPGCPASRAPSSPTQFEVTVTETVSNFFAQLLGVPTTTIRRTAVAEYEEPVAMGSPANIFGNEPRGTNDGPAWDNLAFAPHLWGNVAGPQADKNNGDAIQADACGDGVDQNCPGGATPNGDYGTDGYIYKVTVDQSLHSGDSLHIQVFDPAAIHVGDHCDQNENFIKSIPRPIVNPYTTAADSMLRYDWGDTSNRVPVGGDFGRFCTGDQQDSGADAPVTTMVVRSYTSPNGQVQDNPALASGTCGGIQYPGYGKGKIDLRTALDASSPSYNNYAASVFRQWVTVCSFTPVGPGSYLLQIRTNIPQTIPTDTATMQGSASNVLASLPNTGGSNRFAIRAAWFSGASLLPSADVNIAGVKAMGLYANSAATDPTPNFYMARVLPPASGSVTVEVKLWDIGDCGGCFQDSVDLGFSIPAPATATVSCSVKWKVGLGQVTEGNNCDFKTWPISGAYNGQSNYLVIDVKISSYSCTVSNVSDCWVHMKYTTSSGALNDTTTWSAALLGAPVRLIQ